MRLNLIQHCLMDHRYNVNKVSLINDLNNKAITFNTFLLTLLRIAQTKLFHTHCLNLSPT